MLVICKGLGNRELLVRWELKDGVISLIGQYKASGMLGTQGWHDLTCFYLRNNSSYSMEKGLKRSKSRPAGDCLRNQGKADGSFWKDE